MRRYERRIGRRSWVAKPPHGEVITSVTFAVQVGVSACGSDAQICHAGKRADVQKALVQDVIGHWQSCPAARREIIPCFARKCLAQLLDTDLLQQSLVIRELSCHVAGFGGEDSRRAEASLAQSDNSLQHQFVGPEE